MSARPNQTSRKQYGKRKATRKIQHKSAIYDSFTQTKRVDERGRARDSRHFCRASKGGRTNLFWSSLDGVWTLATARYITTFMSLFDNRLNKFVGDTASLP